MAASELSSWFDRLGAEYLEERVAAGDEREQARRGIERDRAEFFPGGLPAPGQLVFALIDDGRAVGSLWIGTMRKRPPQQWWVWSVEIEADFRGRGYGRAAMELAEAEARRGGASRLGLNVSGRNAVARGLYESLGYETVELQMSKELRACRGAGQ
jgi:ribosomal protein S18 acetylase RimI-like enzyme